MRILKMTWKFITSLLRGILGTARSTGTPASAVPPVHCADAAEKLEAAAYALRRIECLTNEKAVMFMPEIEEVHGIAQKAYRKTQK